MHPYCGMALEQEVAPFVDQPRELPDPKSIWGKNVILCHFFPQQLCFRGLGIAIM